MADLCRGSFVWQLKVMALPSWGEGEGMALSTGAGNSSGRDKKERLSLRKRALTLSLGKEPSQERSI